MTCGYTRAEIEEQIAVLKAELAALATQITAANATMSYSLDTGQTRTSVTRQQISQMTSRRWALLNELQFWQNMLCGTGSSYGRPAF